MPAQKAATASKDDKCLHAIQSSYLPIYQLFHGDVHEDKSNAEGKEG